MDQRQEWAAQDTGDGERHEHQGENDLSREEILDDGFRAEYFRGYVRAMAEAVAEDGVDVRAYMAWSLME